MSTTRVEVGEPFQGGEQPPELSIAVTVKTQWAMCTPEVHGKTGKRKVSQRQKKGGFSIGNVRCAGGGIGCLCVSIRNYIMGV